VGDLASNPGDIDDLVEIEDGKLKLRLGGALYKNAESSTREVTAVASQIEASTIQFDAVRGGASDLTIEGSDLLATDSIELNATGEVALLDARHEYTREDLSQQGTAVVSLTARNEYEQVTRAVKAVRDAERDLRHARDDYDLYQDELDAQQAELRRLEQQYATGNGFIEREDINEFKRHLERMKDDREFYEANIALATVTLASKTTALIQQTGRAASSSATYGFNLALDLDIEAIERQVDEYYRQSRASNLSANRLSINAGDVAWLRGANLLAQDSIDIVAQDIDIFAASSTVGSKDREQQVSFGYSWSLMGDAFTADPRELGSNISGEGSERESDSRTYANAQLLAANIRLEAIGDTTIKGADIHAEEKLDIIAGNLDVASVQNLSSTESHSRGLSYSGSGTGANASEGYSESLETQVTRLTGREVDISVADHTDLEGAVIASVDAQGADNGRLTLTTETLRASSLNNTLDSEDRSLGLLAGQTSTLDYRDETGNTKTRALATLGHGNIRVDDTGLSDTRFLNTDITDTEVAIYDIESHQGLSGELDIRLLSEQGRTEIAEDWLKTRMIGNTLELMVTTERVGIEDFFNETGKTHNTYQAVKQQIAADPELAAMLQDPSLTPELKQRMLDQVTDAVMRQLGLSPHDNKIIATERTAPDGSRILGFYSEQTGNAYINDPENDSIRELVVTAGPISKIRPSKTAATTTYTPKTSAKISPAMPTSH
jgi:filamentous hemagglutinin